jgi:hypothetical protein
MTLRSRLAVASAPSAELVPVSKVYGNAVPPQILAAEQAQQMTPASPFSPGEPISPYFGYSTQPRTRDYITGYNIATRPRTHERVSFDTLTGLIDAYDVVQMCIWHRIDTLRSVKYRLVPADGYSGDVEGAIEVGRQVLKKPDGRHYFKNWLAAWLYDVLAYDAGTLYRLRNRGGRCVGLQPVDGTSIAPLLDYWGNEPLGDAPAYVQYTQGLPGDWLTRADLIYEPMRRVNKSIYGKAPIESIILNANTDIRFQMYFLQTFTEGNIPAAFASSPDSWTPENIENWQAYWDSFMYGDQARKSQIRWMPGGTGITWSDQKDFTDQFSLFMMRKTCASLHVVPTDLGFTDSSNYSTGESQADVAHKVGELPLMEYVEEIITQFVYDDLQLPLKFEFDRGEDQDDRAVQASADIQYIQNAVVGVDEIREMRFGLPSDQLHPVPRMFVTARGGPIPLSAIAAVAGPVDPETGAPADGAPLPHTAFGTVEGVIADPPVLETPLAVQEYGPSALPPMPPQQPMAPGATAAGPVAKEGDAAPGITAETGIYGNPLEGAEDDDEDREKVAKAELTAFASYRRKRRKAGEWRDFKFNYVPAPDAARLNTEGRASVRKDGTPDLNPRSGMISLDLQPGLVDQVPGGVEDHHVTVVYLGPDVSDDALAAACDRAQQAAASIGAPLSGTVSGIGAFPPSDSSDGKVPVWAAIAVPGAERLREALADLSASQFADWQPHVTLAYLDPGEPLPAPLDPRPVTFTHLNVHCGGQVVASYPLGGEPVAKAGDSGGPKGGSPAWPGWALDLPAAGYWGGQVASALGSVLTETEATRIATAWLASPESSKQHDGKRDAVQAAAAWLQSNGPDLEAALEPLMTGLLTDGMLIGAVSAQAVTSGTQVAKAKPKGGLGKHPLANLPAHAPVQAGGWKPGDTANANGILGNLGLKGPDPQHAKATGQKLAAGVRTSLGRVLVEGQQSGADPAETGQKAFAAVTDKVKAAAAVLNQITSDSAQAASHWYLNVGVHWVEWLTEEDAKVCPVCEANEAAGPVKLGEPFPSGDTEPPAHPNCRCAFLPAGWIKPPPGPMQPPPSAEATEPEAPVAAQPVPAEPASEPPAEPAGPVAEADALAGAYQAGYEGGQRMSGGMGGVQRVTLSDGTQAVLKTHEEPSQALHEYLSGLAGRALGITGARTAVVGEDTTVSALVPGDTAAEFIDRASLGALKGGGTDYEKSEAAALAEEARQMQLGNGRQIGLLDFLTNNIDRNWGNWLVDGDTVYPVDQALCDFAVQFPGRPGVEMPSPFSRYWLSAGQDTGGYGNITEADLRNPFSAGEMKDFRSALEQLQPEFAAKDASGEYEFMMNRLATLEQVK